MMPQNEEGSEKEWSGADLQLGAMRKLFKREGKRERETNRKVPITNSTNKKKRKGMYA